MKTLIYSLSLFSLCILFIGCPYESTVPIDKPSVKINPKLLGSWKGIENKGEEYKVTKKDEFTYQIEYSKTKENTVQIFLAYTSIINGVPFLNLWENKENEIHHGYSLYKLEIKSDDRVTLFEVTENVDERFSSSTDLKKFIAANMRNSYFFGKDKLELFRIIN